MQSMANAALAKEARDRDKGWLSRFTVTMRHSSRVAASTTS
jgi:hypothetical protein